MGDDVKGWSCYTTSPADSLELLERVRGRCPLPHSEQHDGFHLLHTRPARGHLRNHWELRRSPRILVTARKSCRTISA